MKPRRIKSIDELCRLSGDKELSCFILLFPGNLISRKTVRYNPRTTKFKVTHHIDDSTIFYTFNELLHKSNLGLALEKKCLYWR